MAKTYAERLENLEKRRIDPDLILEKSAVEKFSVNEMLKEAYTKLDEVDVYKYFIGAMQPVDGVYTRNTYAEAERIQNQLDKIKESNFDFSYEYQGSVSNNTHIKAHSDIDILVLINKFFTLEPPQEPSNPYKGNPINDLLELREKCERHLKSAFHAATVDCSGAKSISLSGGSLRRKIDVVPSNWYDTVRYSDTCNKIYRGVQVLDKYKRERIKNTPFYHNYLIDVKDNACHLNFKRTIRLLKNLKADAEVDIKFSSYDIVAVLYHMDNLKYFVGDKYLMLLKNVKEHLEFVINSSLFQSNKSVPDNSRLIFDSPDKLNELKKLKYEIDSLYVDVMEELNSNGMIIDKKVFVI